MNLLVSGISKVWAFPRVLGFLLLSWIQPGLIRSAGSSSSFIQSLLNSYIMEQALTLAAVKHIKLTLMQIRTHPDYSFL